MREHKLTHPELVEFLREQIITAGNHSVAVLILGLRRTARMDSITGRISAQSVVGHVDQILESLLRDGDRYAHLDGEQILLVLSSLANADHSVLAAVKIMSELAKPFIADTHPMTLRPCVGIANFPDLGRDSDQLLMCADIALQIAATDEHGYHVCQPGDMVEAKVYNGLDVELRKAISENELRVNFQPKVSFKTGKCISAEALLRWTAPWGEEINPSVLVGAAEDSAQINPLTLRILNTALRHMATFIASGVDIGLNVNLPPKMLEDHELPQIVQQALDIWGVPASKLTLEITESSMISNIEPSIAMLTRLRELGIRLSIDDFGTGYSSLAYLKRLPVQELKIDIMFIRNMHSSIGDRKLVRTIIDLAHNFDLNTVAEGVEDQQTFDLLRELGCDEAQGFLFSRALPEAEFIDWYRKQSAV